jgi:hypothetical protein
LARPEINNVPVSPEIKSELAPAEVRKDASPSDQPEPVAKEIAMPRKTPLNDKNLKLNMENKNKPAFDDVAQGVARIMFGDENITEMNVRLIRIALERYNVPEMHSFDEIAQGVARVIFGDENITEMNVRLTRIALERFNVPEMLGRPAEANNTPVDVPRLAAVSL